MLSIALLCERFHGPTGRLELVEADAHPGLVRGRVRETGPDI